MVRASEEFFSGSGSHQAGNQVIERNIACKICVETRSLSSPHHLPSTQSTSKHRSLGGGWRYRWWLFEPLVGIWDDFSMNRPTFSTFFQLDWNHNLVKWIQFNTCIIILWICLYIYMCHASTLPSGVGKHAGLMNMWLKHEASGGYPGEVYWWETAGWIRSTTCCPPRGGRGRFILQIDAVVPSFICTKRFWFLELIIVYRWEYSRNPKWWEAKDDWMFWFWIVREFASRCMFRNWTWESYWTRG